MKTGEILRTGTGALLVALTLALSAAPGAAQSTSDCRCVDRDGNPVERCSCFRAPKIPGFGQMWTSSDARPRLGISVDVRQSARRDASGALVTDVLEGGPADEAGIELGDVITSLGGHSLFEPLAGGVEDDFDLDQSIPVQRLLAIARDLEPGAKVEVVYRRDGQERSATVAAEELSASWGTALPFASPHFDAGRLRDELRELTSDTRTMRFRLGGPGADGRRDFEYLFEPRGDRGEIHVFGGDDGAGVVIDRLRGTFDGLELVALNPELGSYFGAEEGVLVANVHEDSTLGLAPGDVVLSIGERPVTTPDRMRRILQSYGADEDITFQVRRDGGERTVTGHRGR